MDYREWQRVMLTEAKVLSYLRRALQKQNQEPERDVTALVKRGDGFVYKAYSAKAQHALTGDMKLPVPVYQAVLDNTPEQFPGFEWLLRRKRREYDCQEQQFSDMAEEPSISAWLEEHRLGLLAGEAFIMDTQAADRYFEGRFAVFQKAVSALQELNEVQFIHDHDWVQALIDKLGEAFTSKYGDYVLWGCDMTPTPLEEFLRKAQPGGHYCFGAVLRYQ